MPNNDEHEELKNIIKTFLEKSDFEIVDTEVNFDFIRDGQSDFSIDVCAVHEKYLIAIECKSTQLSNPKSKIKSALTNMKDVIKLREQKILLKTDHKKITNKRLKKIEEFRYCYAFGKKFNNKNLEKILQQNNIGLWNYKTLQYYSKVSKVLGIFIRNEILRDFDIPIAKRGKHSEDAQYKLSKEIILQCIF